MAFDGFISLAGVELINSERTASYVRNQLPGFPLKDTVGAHDLHTALEDDRYESPLIDGAEWVNPLEPATHRFYGMYPLSIEGIGSSTVSAEVTEATLDGGSVGTERAATRALRITALMIAADELALEAGLTWLRSAVRADGCGMHGGSCGTSDFRYFLAEPSVCDPAFRKAVEPGYRSEQLGSLSPDSSPLIYRWDTSVDPAMPSHAYWVLPATDGTYVQWGALELDSPKVIYESAIVALQRTNFVQNPSFTVDTGTWSTVGGTITRIATGGVDGGARASIQQDTPMTVRINWAPDPRFSLADPAGAGWLTENGTVAQVANRGVFTRTDPAAVMRASISTLGPYDAPVASLMSFYLGVHAADVLAEVFDNEGLLVTSQTIAPGAAGVRTSIATTMWENYTLRLTTTDDSLTVYDLLFEEGVVLGAAFSGDSPSVGALAYEWAGEPALSASRSLDGAESTHTTTAVLAPTPNGDLTASFWLRSREGATVIARIRNATTNVILAEIEVPASFTWQRYSLATPYGRNVKLEFYSSRQYRLDQVMVEAGNIVGDYFDGDSAVPDGYSLTWLAGHSLSASRLIYTDQMAFSRSDSRWRPFITALQGSVTSTELRWTMHEQIPMSEQLEPYERRYHGVSVTQGPTIISHRAFSTGVTAQVELILVAENPWAYSTNKEIDLTGLASAFYSDRVANKVYNPSANGAGNLTAITSATVSAISTDTFAGWIGPKSFKFTSTTSARSRVGFALSDSPGAVAHEPWVFSASLYNAMGSARNLLVGIRFYDASNNLLQDSLTAVVVPANSATRISFTADSPAGTTHAQAFVGREGGGGAAANDVTYTDHWLFQRGTVADPYFSGSTADDDVWTYSWAGAADASQSFRVRTPIASPISKLVDPDCPPLPSPPRPPLIPALCVDDETDWQRYMVNIPAEDVSLWAGTVPTITLSTKTAPVRQLRVRFHANPFGYPLTAVDPTDYCGEFIVSYLPKNSVLIVNGMMEDAFASVAGAQTVPADQLLYGTDGVPITWPELSCGIAYLMTIDIPPTDDIDNLEIDLVVNRRE